MGLPSTIVAGLVMIFVLFHPNQASFLIKRDPIAEDRVIVILKFFGILPVFDLVKGRCAVFGHVPYWSPPHTLLRQKYRLETHGKSLLCSHGS